jgi:hypothetical protein
MNLRSSLRTLAFASVCTLPLPAGVVTINFTETGANVVVTLSGKLTDSARWTPLIPASTANLVYPDFGGIQFGGSLAGDLYLAPSATNVGNWTGGFGSGSTPITTLSSSGDLFGFVPLLGSIVDNSGPFPQGTTVSALWLPAGYSFSSQTKLSSTMTFTGTTIAGLGITPGTYAATYGNDTIQLTFGGGGSSSVPDAGPGPALALLLGGLGLRQWHSSRRSRAAA